MVKIYFLKPKTEYKKSDLSPIAYKFLNEFAKLELGLNSDVILEINKAKKPYFVEYENLKFNISHCENLITIAISDTEIGIDAEMIRNINFNIINRFSGEEKAYIEEDPQKRFFEIWTKKEAFAKYKGDGIKKGFSSFNILNPVISGLLKTFYFDEYIVSVCSEQNINENDFIFLEI